MLLLGVEVNVWKNIMLFFFSFKEEKIVNLVLNFPLLSIFIKVLKNWMGCLSNEYKFIDW